MDHDTPYQADFLVADSIISRINRCHVLYQPGSGARHASTFHPNSLHATRSPESFVNQAEEYYAAGKINQAIKAYKDAIYSDPANPANYVALARLQVFAGSYDEAIVNCPERLTKEPE